MRHIIPAFLPDDYRSRVEDPMRFQMKDLFPREHGFYVMTIVPVAIGTALNWKHAGGAVMAGLAWSLLTLSSAGVRSWLLHPSKRAHLTAPLALIVLAAWACFTWSGVPLGLVLSGFVGLGALGGHFAFSTPKERRSTVFEGLASFVLAFGMLVAGSAGRQIIPLGVAQAALVYSFVQVAATLHVRLWIEALSDRTGRGRREYLAETLAAHALFIGITGLFCLLKWLPADTLIPGACEGAVMMGTLPWFGRKVSFPKLGIAQTVGLVATGIVLTLQFTR